MTTNNREAGKFRRLPGVFCFVFGAIVCFGFAVRTGADAGRDPKAVEVARAMMRTMGGENAWDRAYFIRFDFRVTEGGKKALDRSHLWDKQTGRYRLEEKAKGGKTRVVLFNAYNRQGSAYVNGKPLEGADSQKALEDAYGAFINDMWWLAMPWKWFDPGVSLKYLGIQTRRGETDDVVELTFNHVGLTPGDMYHAFVSQKSHLMTQWEYVLQDGEKGAWDWQYGDYGGIKLARNHTSADRKMAISMGEVRVLDTAEDAFFTDPSHGLSGLK